MTQQREWVAEAYAFLREMGEAMVLKHVWKITAQKLAQDCKIAFPGHKYKFSRLTHEQQANLLACKLVIDDIAVKEDDVEMPDVYLNYTQRIEDLVRSRDMYQHLLGREKNIGDELLRQLKRTTDQRNKMAQELNVNPETYAL